MPDLSWNKAYWDGAYDWQGQGEEWSEAWGGSEPQWFGCLYPRLHRFLPADNVLEIAPGFGRWTHYLIDYVRGHYHGVDISQECIDYCAEVFAADSRARFSVNNGYSLEMVEDDAFDLVFSFDSLVHAELDVHERYIPQILRKLNQNGVAFIHHSNWASGCETQKNLHARGESVSADAVGDIIVENGGRVILQECLNWGEDSDNLIDTLSLFCRKDREKVTASTRIENQNFMLEASILRSVHSRYCGR